MANKVDAKKWEVWRKRVAELSRRASKFQEIREAKKEKERIRTKLYAANRAKDIIKEVGIFSAMHTLEFIECMHVLYKNMTPEEKEMARRSFAYGNANIDNPNVTRDIVEEAAENLKKKNE